MNKKCFLVIVLFISLCSCKKDETIPIGDCFTWSEWDDLPCGNFTYELNPASVFYPCYNPNDPNEILYTNYLDNGSQGLHRYNIATKTSTEICQSQGFDSRVEWGKNDWMLFGEGSQLFKIHATGTGLMQITTVPSNYFPFWNREGTKIVFKQLANGQNPYRTIIMDENGTFLDTLPDDNMPVGNSLKNGCGLSNNRVACVLYHATKTIRIITENPFQQVKEITPLVASSDVLGDGAILDMDYIPGTSSILWSSNWGIYVTDFETETTKQIKQACDAIQYRFVSVSPDGQKFVVETLVNSYVSGCVFEQNFEIRQMNVDGSGEVTLSIQ